jgi:hypothetical protein
MNKLIILKYGDHLGIITTIISYSNSVSNPLLYIFLTNNFSMVKDLRKRFL